MASNTEVKLPSKLDIKKNLLEDLLKRRFFYTPSFSIYGGVAGLYDLGPPACAVKANILDFWRKHFVLEESMLEVDCASVTPEEVLKTSGHVEKFTDFMVRDVKTGACYRADHLLEAACETASKTPGMTEEQKEALSALAGRADSLSREELGAELTALNVKAPDTGNDISEPQPFNLMFKTQIGPTGDLTGYLRPETAQGIFVNFPRLLEQNGGRMPFAAAQIGQAYRNEIAPRSGLLRVREFTLAEIEHFCSPTDKSHPKIASVRDVTVYMYNRQAQETTQKQTLISIGEALDLKWVNSETLAYFIARVAMFLWGIGVQPQGLRFRQHHAKEMAHYACDCWDAEILTSHGWVESVGIADRSCYDLTVHAARTKSRMTYFEELKEPIVKQVLEPKINKGMIGKTYRKDAAAIIKFIEEMAEEDKEALNAALEADGKSKLAIESEVFEIEKAMVSFSSKQKRITGENVLPAVIEPSFGIGRILYGVLEHAYYHRADDEQRGVLRLSARIAPVKCSVLPLTNDADMKPFVAEVANALTEIGLYNKIDDSSQAIGKRYARTDEIGIPFGITIDKQTIEDRTVTLRHRDTCDQIRVSIDKVAVLVHSLIANKQQWEDVMKSHQA